MDYLLFVLFLAASTSSSSASKEPPSSDDDDDGDDDEDHDLMDDDDEDEEDEMPLDMEEVENASKKARQEEEIHSEHVQVRYFAGFISYCIHFQKGFRRRKNT